MKKFFTLSLIFVITMVLGGCEDNAAVKQLPTAKEARKIELAYPYIYEKGVRYEGELLANEVRICQQSVPFLPTFESTVFIFNGMAEKGEYVWDSTTPKVKKANWFAELTQQIKSGNQKAIAEVSRMLPQLIQFYHPDKVGFDLLYNDTTNEVGVSVVGEGDKKELSWMELLSKLDIKDEPGVLQLAKLLSPQHQKVKIRYVKHSLEQLCLAYRSLFTDIHASIYRAHENHQFFYNQKEDMILFCARKNASVPGDLLGSDNLPPPSRIVQINDWIEDLPALIRNKYGKLIYYSESEDIAAGCKL